MDDEAEAPPHTLPLRLRALAYLTVAAGIACALEMVPELLMGRFDLNPGIIQIPAGFGLLRLSPGWRKFQLLVCGFVFFTTGLAMALTLLSDETYLVGIVRPGEAHTKILSFLVLLGFFAYAVWVFRVLRNPEIRGLFEASVEDQEPVERPEVPRDLEIVAWITILAGYASILGLLFSRKQPLVSPFLGLLHIPAAFGLLRLSRPWRRFLLIMLWLLIASSVALGAAILMSEGDELARRYFGFKTAPRVFALAILLGYMGYAVWAQWVLSRADVQKLFGVDPAPNRS